MHLENCFIDSCICVNLNHEIKNHYLFVSCYISRCFQIVFFPAVIEEDAIADVEEALVVLIELVLPAEQSVAGHAVVPDDLRVRLPRVHALRQESHESNECRNGGCGRKK